MKKKDVAAQYGLPATQEEASEETLEQDMRSVVDWNKLQNMEVQLEDYVICDEGLATAETLIDAKIIDILNQNIDDETDVDHRDPADFQPLIPNKEARAAVNTLRTYVERCDDIKNHVFGSLFKLEKIIDTKSANYL